MEDGGSLGCVLFLGLCGAGLLALLIFIVQSSARSNRLAAERAAKELRDAHDTYKACLAELKRNPTDPNLRERTLEWGRHYSNLTRQRQGVTIFDELALSNDIAAACAGAVTAPLGVQPSGALEERLQRLSDLRSSGVITDAEYRERRSELLREV